MSEYTPTTEEVREAIAEWAWSRRMFRPELADSDGKEADRWLAAHDAEKDYEIAKQGDIIALLREDEAELHRLRAGVLPEEPSNHEDWCHKVTGCTERYHCTCDREERR
ncbi:hypothetical protein FVO59_11880 [Microbacterium esteraromaticum]|uniref:Uncharacterized protein n=1 Tax=Microbacterium esteraromaticum TaxID=57043 RepID=A0A7D8AM09_9MICO|nr:hypothetical protein [Microbacterium esteraromaticum]QMU97827.1 hypothetical protein FVO59_11880 [Microbacterium esteraromaticum]